MTTLKLSEKTISAIAAPSDAAQAYYWDTELKGFGVVVGKVRRTFVARGRVGGRQIKRTIGVLGAPRADGHSWTALLARQEARVLLGQMADGETPVTTSARSGPTLREGVELHVRNMRKKSRSERSIETIESEVMRLLEAWLDRPIAELTGAELLAVHDRMTDAGTPMLANRLVAHVSAIWNTLDRVHELDGRNPARAVTRNKYVPSRERVADDELPGWLEKVMALPNSVRRDLQLFCLFTAMRSEAARSVRWEHIDEDEAALDVPRPKGGEERAFRLPLSKTMIEMLERRRRENREDFKAWGGDGGWVFPSLTREAPQTVQPVAEPKEYRRNAKTKQKEQVLPGLHTLRRTYESVAHEAGISEIDLHVLTNHSYASHNVNATYIKQQFAHLAECQTRIEAALWARLKPSTKPGRAKLRAV